MRSALGLIKYASLRAQASGSETVLYSTGLADISSVLLLLCDVHYKPLNELQCWRGIVSGEMWVMCSCLTGWCLCCQRVTVRVPALNLTPKMEKNHACKTHKDTFSHTLALKSIWTLMLKRFHLVRFFTFIHLCLCLYFSISIFNYLNIVLSKM